MKNLLSLPNLYRFSFQTLFSNFQKNESSFDEYVISLPPDGSDVTAREYKNIIVVEYKLSLFDLGYVLYPPDNEWLILPEYLKIALFEQRKKFLMQIADLNEKKRSLAIKNHIYNLEELQN